MKNSKFVAAVVAAAGYGAAVAWAITADRAERNLEKLSQDYLDMQEALRDKTREVVELKFDNDELRGENEALHAAVDDETGFTDENLDAATENSPGEAAPENVSASEDYEPHVEREPTDEELDAQREELRAQIRGYIPTEDDERVFQEEQGGPVIASTKYDPPFVISQPDYAYGDEGQHHDNITLRYFPNHQVLLDEEDEVIDDVDRYVGWRSLSQFGGESGDDNVVYVRNRNMEVDFEVERVTDEDLPLHVKFGMPKIEFKAQRASGKLSWPEEDEG